MATNSTPFEWLSGGLFFGNRGDKASDIDNCKDALTLLRGTAESAAKLYDDDGEHEEKVDEDAEKLLAARLRRLRFLLYQERRDSSQSESSRKPMVAIKTMEGLTGSTLESIVPTLLQNMGRVPFETRKDVAAIFNYLLICGLEGSDASIYATVMKGFRGFVEQRFDDIMASILKHHDCMSKGGSTPDVMLHAGSMYRSCLRHLSLYRMLVKSKESVKNYVFPFLDEFVHSPDFDVASDAMESLKVVLTGKLVGADEAAQTSMYALTAEFLNRDYTEIWDERFIPKLLSGPSSNYIIRRMALQILSTVLLTRSNYEIMIRFVASKENLKQAMLLLRDTSPHITLDAFHVFKIFVANPNKPPEIIKILSDNKEKLCKYLETLHRDREANDTQFRDEKALIIQTIQNL